MDETKTAVPEALSLLPSPARRSPDGFPSAPPARAMLPADPWLARLAASSPLHGTAVKDAIGAGRRSAAMAGHIGYNRSFVFRLVLPRPAPLCYLTGPGLAASSDPPGLLLGEGEIADVMQD
ncbi:hypothetical protein BU23DRAFT_274320 [Bimuria novae-zelandiae CBS 107.79]|uniref:Uncharacterized protein n=1 Tax=Bimuria novae-zelandiae CBS 107.79 TaxID=1447943 RepID=A0A6A5VKS9_9PLEO|nr:hypothetical protein BU23DRAFT_274320 [Bimuria novae-zelandiae CBS 107.79]